MKRGRSLDGTFPRSLRRVTSASSALTRINLAQRNPCYRVALLEPRAGGGEGA